MFDREGLIGLFKERALKFGDFTLVSGKKSTYYMDGKADHPARQGVATGQRRSAGPVEATSNPMPSAECRSEQIRL